MRTVHRYLHSIAPSSTRPFFRHNRPSPCLALFVVSLSLLFTISPLAATFAATTQKDLHHLEALQKKKMTRLKRGMQSKKKDLEEHKKLELTLYNELKEIDTKLIQRQEQLMRSQEQLLKQEGFLATKEIEYGLIIEDKKKAETHIKNRLQAFYQMGDIGIINTIFSASTLPELLNTKEYFHYLFLYDRGVIKQYKTKLALLANARQAMLSGKQTLLETINLSKQQEKDLITFRQQRATLLKEIQTKESLYKQALDEMQKSAQQLTTTFQQYKKKLIINAKNKKRKAHTPAGKGSGKIGILALKGHLPPPVEHGTVTTKFGKGKSLFGVEIDSKGIDIQVQEKSRVQAVFQGTIAFAGELPGYGNVVIIDHDHGYFSLVSHMTRVLAKKGARVRQGDTLGLLDKDQSGLLKKGLHFEIRAGSTPEDPIPWLDSKRLTIALSHSNS